MSHTPGPWKINRGFGAPEIHSKQRRIAKVLYHMGSEDTEVDNNSHLIKAAPNLLSACESALESIEIAKFHLIGGTPARGVFDGSFMGVERELRTAIARAKGKTE